MRIIQEDNAVPIAESQSHSFNNIDTLLHTDVVVAVKQINNQTEEHQYTYQTDLGLWKSVPNDVQEYFISKGSGESQNITDNFEKSKWVYDNPNEGSKILQCFN